MRFSRVFITGGSGFIGTNLVESLSEHSGISILNVDIAPPKIETHRRFWKDIDIRDNSSMSSAYEEFRPELVIHLAARTDLDGKAIADYTTNTDGTKVVVDLIAKSGNLVAAIFTSSMYVCKPGYRPLGPSDYKPHTVYGESKVIGEQIVKEKKLASPWAIVRPTSIWGPWFGVPYIDFFNVVLKKRFVHIGGVDTQKTYGYVGNTVAQIIAIAERIESVSGEVIYLGDWPAYSIKEWANEIADAVPYRVPTVPKSTMAALAKVGDFIVRFGGRFPMTSFRLSNMMTDNVHDLSTVRSILPQLPYERAVGNKLTLSWLKRSN